MVAKECSRSFIVSHALRENSGDSNGALQHERLMKTEKYFRAVLLLLTVLKYRVIVHERILKEEISHKIKIIYSQPSTCCLLLYLV